MNNAQGYGAIAHIYDIFNSDVDYESLADFAEEYFDRFLPERPELVLDLACGTGILTAMLAERGYDMTGIDLSPEMLSVARENCPEDVLLLLQDITAFELYGTVGAVLCTLDSLNHLTRKGQIERCFSLVHNYLDPNGLFIFDMNTPARFEKEYGKNSYQLEAETEDGCAVFCNWQNDYSEKRGICRFSLSVFTEQEAGSEIYSRRDEEWSERCYTRAEIEEKLRNAGFEICGVFGNTKFKRTAKSDSKFYFVARAIK
jgi:SAM-dependent methyltransferase